MVDLYGRMAIHLSEVSARNTVRCNSWINEVMAGNNVLYLSKLSLDSEK